MTLTEKLSVLISTYMLRPGHIAETQSDFEPIMSALREGNCSPEELEFLYVDFSAPVSSKKYQDILVPNYRSDALSIAE